MGFRSTFITQDYSLLIPDWFKEKYKDWVFSNGKLPIASQMEIKTYATYSAGVDLEKDIQKVLKEDKQTSLDQLVLVWLHECGGITRVEIHKDKILYSEPETWKQVEEVTHNYCHGCSDVKNLTKNT